MSQLYKLNKHVTCKFYDANSLVILINQAESDLHVQFIVLNLTFETFIQNTYVYHYKLYNTFSLQKEGLENKGKLI